MSVPVMYEVDFGVRLTLTEDEVNDLILYYFNDGQYRDATVTFLDAVLERLFEQHPNLKPVALALKERAHDSHAPTT